MLGFQCTPEESSSPIVTVMHTGESRLRNDGTAGRGTSSAFRGCLLESKVRPVLVGVAHIFG
jgi:hypothetical protein